MPSNSVGTGQSGYTRLFIAGAMLLFLDLATKAWVQHGSDMNLGDYWPAGGHEIVPGFFYLCYISNKGAAWGLFEGFSGALAGLAFIALFLVWKFRVELGLRYKVVQIPFGILIGGIIGNLIDRIRYGYVVDFLDFHLPVSIPYVLEQGRWPAFNIADCGITVGVCIYIGVSFFIAPVEEAETSAEEDSA